MQLVFEMLLKLWWFWEGLTESMTGRPGGHTLGKNFANVPGSGCMYCTVLYVWLDCV